jgi:hypothetical protein
VNNIKYAEYNMHMHGKAAAWKLEAEAFGKKRECKDM